MRRLLMALMTGTLLVASSAAFAGKITDEQAQSMGRWITLEAHPTAKNISLLSHTETKKNGKIYLKMKVEYFGAFSHNRYTADALIEVKAPKEKGDPPVVKHVDFLDHNNATPPNKRNMQRIADTLNAKFRMDAASN